MTWQYSARCIKLGAVLNLVLRSISCISRPSACCASQVIGQVQKCTHLIAHAACATKQSHVKMLCFTRTEHSALQNLLEDLLTKDASSDLNEWSQFPTNAVPWCAGSRQLLAHA